MAVRQIRGSTQIMDASIPNSKLISSPSVSTPQVPTAGFTIVSNTQVLFGVDIDLQAANGDLTVSGILQGVH